MSKSLVVLFTLFVIAIIVFLILNAVGCPMYPRPKFPCSECEQLKKTKNDIYECQACTDEIYGSPLHCNIARCTRDCYKNARKASNEQQQEKA